MNIGDTIRCIDINNISAPISTTEEYIANSIVEIPGDKTYVTVYANQRFYVLDAARFEVVDKEED